MSNDRPIVSEVTPLCRQMAPAFKAWAESLNGRYANLFETFAGGFTARDAEIEDAERCLELADVLYATVSAAMIVSDCNEACEHPACLILRAMRRYRKVRARALLATEPPAAAAPQLGDAEA